MRPEIPEGLQRMILTKLLAKAPAQRYQTMADVEQALAAYHTRGPGPGGGAGGG